MYIENPKTKGSGVICAIPQEGTCPNECADCFFQSGRSYLEPLDENLPNMPSQEEASGRIIRINDGNDSSVQKDLVITETQQYADKFYNTAIPKDLGSFPGPVVLTLNPGEMTNLNFHKLYTDPFPDNLMFVRFRANTWNIWLLKKAIEYYTHIDASRKIPVVVTFMAYYNETIPKGHQRNYTYRKRTLNSYWVIHPNDCASIMQEFWRDSYVYLCGKDAMTFSCQRCGNCIREYYNTKERMRNAV